VENVEKAERLRALLSEFRPVSEPVSRALALYSVAIALASDSTLEEGAIRAVDLGATDRQMYEVILQSYLFLGFPRMLTAAESFRKVFPDFEARIEKDENSFKNWNERGMELCRKVYAGNYEKLKNKVISFTPEIFDWMILEGYGKVLSRKGLNIEIRELAIVSCLIMENRPRQLHSHIQGALNVGVKETLLRTVIEDVSKIDKQGYKTAIELLNRTNATV
jgi:4-carboxymuconolactone decarboxylase